MLLRDPVHGLITFEREEEAIVPKLLATPELQRLRRIRQLGLTCLAFPGAVHTRFAHAIGAAHVMTKFIARMREIHDELPFWQRVTSERARDAIAAALLHDLGHLHRADRAVLKSFSGLNLERNKVSSIVAKGLIVFGILCMYSSV